MVVITVLFFLHPSLTQKGISFFNCTKINGISRMVYDLEVVCLERTHLLWAILVGVPVILLWSIGLPLFGIFFIVKNKKHLHVETFRTKYLILYQGLKPNRSFWEMVNIIRKVILLMINVFIPDDQYFYKVMVGFLFLFTYMRVQQKLQPFKSKMLNTLEQREIICSLSTMYLGLIFIQDDVDLSGFQYMAAFGFAFFQVYFYLMVVWAVIGLKKVKPVWLKILYEIVGYLAMIPHELKQ